MAPSCATGRRGSSRPFRRRSSRSPSAGRSTTSPAIRFDLGLVGIIQFLPALLLVLVTGAVADRFGRRLIMALSSFLEAFCALAILLLTIRGLSGAGPIFVVLALFGVARAFFGPASSALVANLVPAEDFANAVAWNSSAWQTATIVGPVAGGLLYGLAPEAPYAIAALLMLIGGLLVLSIPKPAQRLPSEKPTLDTLFAGFRYIWTREDRARRDLARPVRRAAFRRVGAAAGLCARHIGARPVGPRPAARRARRRRHRRRHLARRPHDQGPCRHHHARLSWRCSAPSRCCSACRR